MDKLIAAFNSVALASLADAVDLVCGKRGYMDCSIKPRINDKRFCGPAATVLAFVLGQLKTRSTAKKLAVTADAAPASVAQVKQ